MLTKKELKQYSTDARENYLPHVSIDCVVFGFHEGEMKVLVLQVKNEDAWYLPGGFVLKLKLGQSGAITMKQTGTMSNDLIVVSEPQLAEKCGYLAEFSIESGHSSCASLAKTKAAHGSQPIDA